MTPRLSGVLWPISRRTMETLTLSDVQAMRGSEGPIQAGWVYVSSLAMRTYRKTPLLRRWCEVSATGTGENVMEFFHDADDLEPTKRIHLEYARVVVSRNSHLTSAQVARMPSISGRSTAFYIDFPKSFRAAAGTSVQAPLFETRSLRAAPAEIADDFPLGFIMVTASSDSAARWEHALVDSCQKFATREKKRTKVQRWLNRAWMRVKGGLSIDQFDEACRSMSVDSQVAENFFSFRKEGKADRGGDRGGEDVDGGSESSSGEESFRTADGVDSSDENSVERQVVCKSVRVGARRESLTPADNEFASVEEMLAEKDEAVRHSTRISRAEIDSVVAHVERTRALSDGTGGQAAVGDEWSLCSQGETFDCFKSIDEASGLVRTRTWAKIAGIPPHCLFHILYDNAARKHWDHHYARFDSIWTDGGDVDVLDAIISAPFGCANREFLEWRRRAVPAADRDERTGKFVIYLRSWSAPTARAVLKGNVRAEVWLSGYLIQWWIDPVTKQALGSDVMVMSQIDIKGLIPRYLVNALSSSAPKKWVRGVTAAAQKELESRKIADSCMSMSESQLDQLYGIVPK